MKIIKQGSPQAAHIQRLSFSSRAEAPINVPLDMPDWMKVPDRGPAASSSPATQQVPAAEMQPQISAADLAQLEKNAYESGFHQGEKAGLAIAEKKIEVGMRRYAEVILSVGKLRSQLYSQVEREVVKLAIEVAKKIVHREVQADQEIIQTLVKVALSHVAEKSAVTVHLHPQDYNYLIEHKAELSSGSNDGQDIVLMADKAVDRGGCLIETSCGDIDARIEEEFREIERSFFDGTRSDGQ
jgi:flagellar biosynthesis/type III secretory pathway protein FliH